MDRKRKLIFIFIFISSFCLILDQASKIIIRRELFEGQSIKIFKFFSISHVENTGAAFSILANSSVGIYFLAGVSILAIPFIVFYAFKLSNNEREIIPFALLLGGNTGNMVDRLFRRSVTDFLDFRIFVYNFPTFNLADVFLVLSIIIIFYKIFFKSAYLKD